MEAYLDNSATTRCYEEVKDKVVQVMMEDYGNTSSMHQKGVDAENQVKEARDVLARILKVKEKELYFTSGGTESNNLAIIGTALANQRQGRHIITTAVEHASGSGPARYLEEMGFEVTVLPVDERGIVDLDVLETAVGEDTVLVSMMYVNSEIGAVQPVEEAARRIKEKNGQTLFHVDAIQAFGKYRIYPARNGIDLLSVSAHKIHGPKGCGLLYARDKVKISPVLFGGGHQNGLRPGTENSPGAAGFGVAAAKIYENMDEKNQKMRELKQLFCEEVQQLEQVVRNSPDEAWCAPHILNLSFVGVRSEVLLHSLEERGIYVSAGSACSSHKKQGDNTVFSAIKAGKERTESGLRFSFCEFTTEEEIRYAANEIKTLVPVLRRYRPH